MMPTARPRFRISETVRSTSSRDVWPLTRRPRLPRETARNGCANVLSRSGNDRDASVEFVSCIAGISALFVGVGYSTLQYAGTQDQTTTGQNGSRGLVAGCLILSGERTSQLSRHVRKVPIRKCVAVRCLTYRTHLELSGRKKARQT